MSNPTQANHTAALRVLKYLKSCPGCGLFFPMNSPIQLLGFFDSDWAECIDTR